MLLSYASRLYPYYFLGNASDNDNNIDGDYDNNSQVDEDVFDGDNNFLAKKYNSIQRKYHALQVEHDKLVFAYQELKKNTLRTFFFSLSHSLNFLPNVLRSHLQRCPTKVDENGSYMLAN
jgi:hypothetical protein